MAHRITRGALMALALLLIVAALVGSLGRPKNATDGPVTEPLTLAEAAEREGEVNLWATNLEDLEWIPRAFALAHPGIRVNTHTDLNVVARVITEHRAGRKDVDLVWNSEALVQPLIDRDLVVRDEWNVHGISPHDVGANGHMAITSSVAFAVAYRSDVIQPSDVPRTWLELNDPKYHRKVAASPILFARLCAALGAFEEEKKWLDFARAFRRTANVLWTNDLLEQAIVSGERMYVAGTANYLAERWKARGLPIEVVLPEPVFVTQFGSVVLKEAPHPNAARLLAIWLSSPEGRAARESALLAVDLRPSSNHPKAVELRESGKTLYVDNETAMKKRNQLIPEMDRIISGMQ